MNPETTDIADIESAKASGFRLAADTLEPLDPVTPAIARKLLFLVGLIFSLRRNLCRETIEDAAQDLRAVLKEYAQAHLADAVGTKTLEGTVKGVLQAEVAGTNNMGRYADVTDGEITLNLN